MLGADSRAQLHQYLAGNVSNRELADWLVKMEYDPAASAEERDALAALRLVVIEEGEGRRNKEDILAAVAAILARESDQKQVITIRTSASTTWREVSRFTGSASVAQRAGI